MVLSSKKHSGQVKHGVGKIPEWERSLLEGSSSTKANLGMAFSPNLLFITCNVQVKSTDSGLCTREIIILAPLPTLCDLEPGPSVSSSVKWR